MRFIYIILLIATTITSCNQIKPNGEIITVDLDQYEKYILTALPPEAFEKRINLYREIAPNTPNDYDYAYVGTKQLLVKINEEVNFSNLHSVIAWVNENPDSVWLKDVTIGILVHKENADIIFFEVYLDGKNNDYINGAINDSSCFEIALYNSYFDNQGKYRVLSDCRIEHNFKKFLSERGFFTDTITKALGR